MTAMADPSYASYIAAAAADERELVRVERTGTRAVVTLDDPGKLNPLSGPLTVQLRAALTELCADPGVRVVILTGTDPAFSAGGDLRLMRDVGHRMADNREGEGVTDTWRWIRLEFGGIARLITRTDKAFIAAVNGAAAG